MHTMHSIRSHVYYYSPIFMNYENHQFACACKSGPVHQGVEGEIIAATYNQRSGLMDIGPIWSVEARNLESTLLGAEPSTVLSHTEKVTADEMLVKKTRATCERYRIQFAKLSAIQRKFLTHYRCGQCGLLPLYQINLLHVKRVRCRKNLAGPQTSTSFCSSAAERVWGRWRKPRRQSMLQAWMWH